PHAGRPARGARSAGNPDLGDDLRPHPLSGRGRGGPGRDRDPRGARPLHLHGGRLCRAVLDRAPRHSSQAARRLGLARDERGRRELRQGPSAHQRPARGLAALGLGPRDLLDPAGAVRALPLYRRLIGLALEHYNVGWDYTLAIPRLEWRMRLACAWPLLIGLATLAKLAAHPNPL